MVRIHWQKLKSHFFTCVSKGSPILIYSIDFMALIVINIPHLENLHSGFCGSTIRLSRNLTLMRFSKVMLWLIAGGLADVILLYWWPHCTRQNSKLWQKKNRSHLLLLLCDLCLPSLGSWIRLVWQALFFMELYWLLPYTSLYHHISKLLPDDFFSLFFFSFWKWMQCVYHE